MEVRRMPGEEMSQNEAVLQWLKREPITPIQALAHLRVMRLAARIRDLKDAGHQIHAQIIESPNGKHFARYELVP